MPQHHQHLGTYSDWVQAAQEQRPLFPIAPPGPETHQRVREVLGFCNRPETPLDVQTERQWARADFGSGEMVLHYGDQVYELWFNQ